MLTSDLSSSMSAFVHFVLNCAQLRTKWTKADMEDDRSEVSINLSADTKQGRELQRLERSLVRNMLTPRYLVLIRPVDLACARVCRALGPTTSRGPSLEHALR